MGRAQGTKKPGNFTQILGERRGVQNSLAHKPGEPSTLIVSRSSTKCSVCGQGADYNEKTHKTILGYQKDPGPGCGALWTHITSSYTGSDIEQATRALRPDLVYVSINF
jgi:hypothetical protein